jgi:hypothetical protein
MESQMSMLARTSEQLEQVAEMFPKWREMQRSFRTTDSELFVRTCHALFHDLIIESALLQTGRCEELGCPLLALRVFSNRPKYAFPMSHLAAV